jgi:hypothetical protein
LNAPRENNSASKELRKLVKNQSRKPSYNVLNELRAVRISFEDDLSTKLNDLIFNRILLLQQQYQQQVDGKQYKNISNASRS